MASVKGRSEKRPKSCTAPVSYGSSEQSDHAHQQTPIGNHQRMTKTRKRSYSAVLPRNVSDDTLRQLLSITRHTRLPPHREHEAETTPTTGASSHALLAVTGQAGFIKVEMKGLRRKGSPRNTPKAAKSQEGEGKSLEGSELGNGGLPSITDTSKVAEDVGTKLTVTVTTRKHISSDCVTSGERGGEGRGKGNPSSKGSPSHQLPDAATGSPSSSLSPPASSLTTGPNLTNNSPPLLSSPPVIVGGTKGAGPCLGNGGKPRRLSGGTAGRLSQGWSPPQPIGPLKGSPVVTHSSPPSATPARKGGVARTKKLAAASLGEGEETGREEGRGQMVMSPTASMTINVNVSEFLTLTENDTDETIT